MDCPFQTSWKFGKTMSIGTEGITLELQPITKSQAGDTVNKKRHH